MNVLVVGANRGLGLELVRHYLAEGHRVVALNRGSSAEYEALAGDTRLQTLRADVSDEESLRQAASELNKASLDLLIFNAAIHLEQAREDILLSNADDVLQTLDANAVGAVRVVKHLRSLLKDDGQLVLISSEAGSIGQCWRGSEYGYCMSKAALNMFAHLMQKREQQMGSGVRVSAIHPGWLRTDMGGQDAHDSAQDAAQEILELLQSKRPAVQETGAGIYTDRTGKVMPW